MIYNYKTLDKIYYFSISSKDDKFLYCLNDTIKVSFELLHDFIDYLELSEFKLLDIPDMENYFCTINLTNNIKTVYQLIGEICHTLIIVYDNDLIQSHHIHVNLNFFYLHITQL